MLFLYCQSLVDPPYNKTYKNIKDRTDQHNLPRKTAMALFHMKTGHGYSAEYLHRMGNLQTFVKNILSWIKAILENTRA